jgi:hypothetical protein
LSAAAQDELVQAITVASFGRRCRSAGLRRVTMTHIGTPHGDHFSAERDGHELKLYSTTGDYGEPATREMAVDGTSGIRTSAGGSLDSAGPQNNCTEWAQRFEGDCREA